MKHTLLYLVTACLLATMPSAVSAQQYQSDHLRQAAARLGIDSLLAKVQEPETRVVEVKGQPIVYRVGKNQMVEHIGLPLFHESMRILQPSPIYDYLEYVTLDHKYHVSENNLQQKELKFVRGSWAQLEQLGDTLDCTIQNLQDKHYRVKWQQGGKDVVVVTFPISYELLANSSRREMERNLIRDLKAFRADSIVPLKVDTLLLEPAETEGVFVLPGQSHLIPSITSNIYVRRDKEGRPRLINDNRQPAESMAIFDTSTVMPVRTGSAPRIWAKPSDCSESSPTSSSSSISTSLMLTGHTSAESTP